MSPVLRLFVVINLVADIGGTIQTPATSSLGHSGSGVARGQISALDTGKPLRRSQVRVLSASSTSGADIASGVTDSFGRFEISDIPNGRFYIRASRAGYLDTEFGQRRFGERGAVVEIADGKTVEFIKIALPRTSIISGCITDELGEPYPGVQVMAMEIRYERGRLIPYPTSTAITDDLGRYRLTGLGPARYYIQALSRETWLNEANETVGYPPTYFPGVSVESALAIDVGVAEEGSAIDFTLTMARAVRVAGRVLRTTGEPAPGQVVALSPALRDHRAVLTGNTIRTTTGVDGTFSFDSVTPGEYNLRSGSRFEAATLYFTVTGDIDNVTLVPRRGSDLTGMILTDGGDPPGFSAAGVRVDVVSQDPDKAVPTLRLPSVRSDWSFRLENVSGPVLFRLRGLPDTWMLDQVKLNDRDITDAVYDVPSGGLQLLGLKLIVSRHQAALAGILTDERGRPVGEGTVVAFAEDRELWTAGSRFMRTTRPSPQGQFSIAGLPRGTYLVAAVAEVMDRQWEDGAFLEALRPHALRVLLSTDETQHLKLTLLAPR